MMPLPAPAAVLLLFLALLTLCQAGHGTPGALSEARVAIVIVSTGVASFDRHLSSTARDSIQRQLAPHEKTVVLVSNALDGTKAPWGHQSIWPLIPRLLSHSPSLEWLLLVEAESRVDMSKLRLLLSSRDSSKAHFLGYGLVDREPVIIHHFHGFDTRDVFEYPDFALGTLLSRKVLDGLAKEVRNKHLSDFAIDPRHEFARLILDKLDVRLTSENEYFCASQGGRHCVVWSGENLSSNQYCMSHPAPNYRSLFVAIKTFSGCHRSRVVVTKRTWAKNARLVEFFSDVEDPYIPTKTLGINNTERVHCAKTMAILKHALEHEELTPEIKWILVADDDTLIGLARLYRLLRCYDPAEMVIVGERYGYGYSADGLAGYDYPTGGAGMVFSIPAARALTSGCQCPSDDSPDEMIIGLCARQLDIPISHSSKFHQARPRDYARALLSRQQPISFHKFEEIDPYEDYMQLLHEDEDDVQWNVHSEL